MPHSAFQTFPRRLALLCTLTALAAGAQAATFEVVHDFAAGTCNQATGNLQINAKGVIYGTCYGGGSGGRGVVYRLKPNGNFTLLHEFQGAPNDGYGPSGGVLLAQDGLLWGTTQQGGANDQGTLFSLSVQGKFKLRASLASGTTGSTGTAPVIQDADGVLYSTTYQGGGSGVQGTLFSYAPPKGPLQVRVEYRTATGAIVPEYGVALGADGLLYGAAADAHVGGNGALYRVNRDGSGFTQLAPFTRTVHGASPNGTPLQASDGQWYGVNATGGSGAKGVIYRWSEAAGLSVLHSFAGGAADGDSPSGGLVQGTDGALYGVTRRGGANADSGTVYRLALDGSFSLLHSFDASSPGGSSPTGKLAVAADGSLYGATAFGPDGDGDPGAIFRIVP